MTHKPLILVVDDEIHILHVVSLKLQNAGFEVLTAHDGQEALDMALEQHPDLVITDFQMPYLNGIELCQRLKANSATTAIPAIMLTARGFALPDESLEQTNIVTVLSKPFSPRELLARVHEVIRPSVTQETDVDC